MKGKANNGDKKNKSVTNCQDFIIPEVRILKDVLVIL